MAKKEKVQEMFNGIAPKYDLLNHLLSMGIDKSWRKKAMKVVGAGRKDLVLDIACGTGDFSIEALKHGVKRVVGADISENMLAVAREKAKAKGLSDQLDFQFGDSENLTFDSNTFDAVTVAFGVRNFEHLELGLTEMCRGLKPGGKVVILEFSTPEHFPMKQLYNFYFRYILPFVGGVISGNRKAYEYLPASVFAFPQGKNFLDIMRGAGYSNVSQQRLTFGKETDFFSLFSFYHSTASRLIGMVMHLAPPPPRGSSDPSMVIMYFSYLFRSTLLLITSLARIISNPALFMASTV